VRGNERENPEELPAQDFRDAEDDVSVGNVPEHLGSEPFPEFHHPLPMARGTQMTAIAGIGRKISILK
jgi:hypothetical protein